MGKQTTLPTQARAPHDEIQLQDLRVKAIIGILPTERTREQPLVAQISMTLDTERAAVLGDLSMSVDYSRLASAITVILVEGRFRLLESAAVALARFILATAPTVTAVSVRLIKPEALGGNGIPHVVVTRSRAEVATLDLDAGSYVLFDCPGTSLRLTIKPNDPRQVAQGSHTAGDIMSRRYADVDVMETMTLQIGSYEA